MGIFLAIIISIILVLPQCFIAHTLGRGTAMIIKKADEMNEEEK